MSPHAQYWKVGLKPLMNTISRMTTHDSNELGVNVEKINFNNHNNNNVCMKELNNHNNNNVCMKELNNDIYIQGERRNDT